MHQRSLFRAILAAVLSLGALACQPPADDMGMEGDDPVPGTSPDTAAIRRGIDETNAAVEAALAAGDAAAFVQRAYTQDATILPPGAPAMSGRPALQEFWSGAIQEMGVTGVDLVTDEVVPLGPGRAYEVGHVTIRTGEGEAHAKYLVVWRRGDDGLWRIEVDAWNETPAPGGEG